MKAERALTLIRDGISMVTGAGGIIWQLWTGSPDPTAMLVCAALLGVPGIFGLVALRPGASDTPGSSSPSLPGSAAPPPSPQSSSPGSSI